MWILQFLITYFRHLNRRTEKTQRSSVFLIFNLVQYCSHLFLYQFLIKLRILINLLKKQIYNVDLPPRKLMKIRSSEISWRFVAIYHIILQFTLYRLSSAIETPLKAVYIRIVHWARSSPIIFSKVKSISAINWI